MAKPDFPLNIDRRRLLATGAAVATAAIALRADRVDAALVMEIARRNEIRREANLPLLSIPKELRRLKARETSEEFERFQAAYGKAVWEEVLKARREAEGRHTRTE